MARSGSSAYAAALLVVVFFAACSGGLFPLGHAHGPTDSGAVLVVICFGAVLAAPELLAMAAVLGPQPHWLRIPLTLAVGILLLGCWLAGGCASSRAGVDVLSVSEWRLFGIGLLCLPSVFLAFQVPLWLVSLMFRWEFAAADPSARPASSSTTTIRGMLIAMVYIGVVLAAARFAARLPVRYESLDQATFWGTLAMVWAACSGLTLVTSLPMLVVVLRATSLLRAVRGIFLYIAFWIVTILALAKYLGWNVFGRQDVTFACTVVVAFAVALAVPLLVARRFGCHLRWGREVTSR